MASHQRLTSPGSQDQAVSALNDFCFVLVFTFLFPYLECGKGPGGGGWGLSGLGHPIISFLAFSHFDGSPCRFLARFNV